MSATVAKWVSVGKWNSYLIDSQRARLGFIREFLHLPTRTHLPLGAPP